MSDNFIPITNLPSQCLPYEGINPGDIKARSYQGNEEEYLSQINPLNLETNYLEVMKRVIQGIDPERLTLGDRLYIIVWECINSYTDIIRIKTICTHCLKEVEISIDLKQLEVIKLPDSFKEPYPVPLPSGKKVELRLLTVGDEIKIEKFQQKHPESVQSYRYARSIVSEEDVIKRLEEYKKMGTKDTATIRAFHEKFYHGPEMSSTFECPKCGREDDVDIPFRLDLLFPDGEVLTSTFGKEL